MASAGIANHRPYFVDRAIQGMNIANGHRFFAGAKPGFREHALFYPASQGNIVQPKTKHARVHVEKLGSS